MALIIISFIASLLYFHKHDPQFASRTIQVEAGQKVISTGPYRLVRHPMYLGSLVMCVFTPLALGSYFAVPVFALTIPIYIFRLRLLIFRVIVKRSMQRGVIPLRPRLLRGFLIASVSKHVDVCRV